MNDIEKLSPDIKKAQAVRAKQESSSLARQMVNEHRALVQGVSVAELRQLVALVPVNTLADVGDGQDNLVPRDQWAVGLTVTVSPWANMEEPSYHLYFNIDTDDFETGGIPVTAGFVAFDHTVDISDVVLQHGPHTLYWQAQGDFTGNPLDGPPLEFYIDIYSPNLLQEPDPLLLPADLPSGDITQEYLDQHGGVTFTLPPFADPRVGDKFSFFINSEAVLVEQDAVAPYSFLVDKAVFDPVAEGLLTLTYTIVDRAGNRTDTSAPQRVRLVKTPGPTEVRAPIIPEGAVISLADARDGVTVLHDYDTAIAADWISFHWQDIPQDSYELPDTSVDVPFENIARPGQVYQATVYYEINRVGKIYTSPPTVVDVDLTYVGPDPDPENPDIVNPDLLPLSLKSSTDLVNQIAPADKGNDATITVPLYTPINVGEIVQVFYAHALQSVAIVTVTQAHIDADEIIVTLPWATIDAQGNGTIPAFYRIYAEGKPENAQQSPSTDIVVTVHNLDDLPLAVFSNRQENINIINCVTEPWINGVDITMEYPFEEGDEITINWVLDNTIVPPTHTEVPADPLEESRTPFSHRVSLSEEGLGTVTYTVPWGVHLTLLTEGCIVAEWSLKRGEVTGNSAPQFVRYSRHRPGSGRPVCPDDDLPAI